MPVSKKRKTKSGKPVKHTPRPVVTLGEVQAIQGYWDQVMPLTEQVDAIMQRGVDLLGELDERFME